MKILTDAELSSDGLDGRTVAVVGYGNQGHAHALNLRDSGASVIVGAREGGGAWARAEADGFEVMQPRQAAARSDVTMLLVPDEVAPDVFQDIRPELTEGDALGFGHGFCIRFRTITPPPGVDVFLAAPVGPGHLLRRRFVRGGGIPVVIAVEQDASGKGERLAQSYAQALGGGRAGVLPSTFREETETDLFGEQAVIVGGVCELMEAGFDTLVEAGYPAELAYFECVHQMKLLVDLVHEEGIAGMREKISRTAAYGDLTRGPRIVDGHVRHRMRQVLAEVRSGAFAQSWIEEHQAGQPWLRPRVAASWRKPIEAVGRRLRALLGRP